MHSTALRVPAPSPPTPPPSCPSGAARQRGTGQGGQARSFLRRSLAQNGPPASVDGTAFPFPPAALFAPRVADLGAWTAVATSTTTPTSFWLLVGAEGVQVGGGGGSPRSCRLSVTPPTPWFARARGLRAARRSLGGEGGGGGGAILCQRAAPPAPYPRPRALAASPRWRSAGPHHQQPLAGGQGVASAACRARAHGLAACAGYGGRGNLRQATGRAAARCLPPTATARRARSVGADARGSHRRRQTPLCAG